MPPRVKKRVVAKKAATKTATKVAATKKKNQTSDADDSDGEDSPTTSRRTRQTGKAHLHLLPRQDASVQALRVSLLPASLRRGRDVSLRRRSQRSLSQSPKTRRLLKIFHGRARGSSSTSHFRTEKKQAQWSAPCYDFFSPDVELGKNKNGKPCAIFTCPRLIDAGFAKITF
ncbi:hypothetical protein BDZ89DRAFT_1051122 [Hymenopellis radicata]|nr:hypothetical protein BDZ89DRAFT_1051122 [Hymenopellis radicata]